jgi:hypothetical protein
MKKLTELIRGYIEERESLFNEMLTETDKGVLHEKGEICVELTEFIRKLNHFKPQDETLLEDELSRKKAELEEVKMDVFQGIRSTISGVSHYKSILREIEFYEKIIKQLK